MPNDKNGIRRKAHDLKQKIITIIIHSYQLMNAYIQEPNTKTAYANLRHSSASRAHTKNICLQILINIVSDEFVIKESKNKNILSNKSEYEFVVLTLCNLLVSEYNIFSSLLLHLSCCQFPMI